MSPDKRRKTIDRRRFLRGSVALGATALLQHLLRGERQRVEADGVLTEPEPPPVRGDLAVDDLDHLVYLPIIRKHGFAARGGSKLGLHTIRPNGALTFVQEVHDAGAHVALVKALDDFGYLRSVKESSPETITVARAQAGCVVAVNPTGDPAEVAHDVMYGSGKYQGHLDRWKYERDVVDYWEVLNEPAPPTIAGHVWMAQFYIEVMNIAEANGYKVALFSFSVGRPKWHDWEAIVETGVFARAKAGGHVLALHEYNWPVSEYRWGEPTEDQPPYEDRGVLTGRYRYLYRDFLFPRDEVIPLTITESGLDPVLRQPDQPETWKERYVETMAWYDNVMREDDYVLGAAMFTIGGIEQWKAYDYEELLWPGNSYGANFLDHIVSLKDE